jgi:hypothetical protein
MQPPTVGAAPCGIHRGVKAQDDCSFIVSCIHLPASVVGNCSIQLWLPLTCVCVCVCVSVYVLFQNTCYGCIQVRGCGWCGATASCGVGTVTGPNDFLCPSTLGGWGWNYCSGSYVIGVCLPPPEVDDSAAVVAIGLQQLNISLQPAQDVAAQHGINMQFLTVWATCDPADYNQSFSATSSIVDHAKGMGASLLAVIGGASDLSTLGSIEALGGTSFYAPPLLAIHSTLPSLSGIYTSSFFPTFLESPYNLMRMCHSDLSTAQALWDLYSSIIYNGSIPADLSQATTVHVIYELESTSSLSPSYELWSMIMAISHKLELASVLMSLPLPPDPTPSDVGTTLLSLLAALSDSSTHVVILITAQPSSTLTLIEAAAEMDLFSRVAWVLSEPAAQAVIDQWAIQQTSALQSLVAAKPLLIFVGNGLLSTDVLCDVGYDESPSPLCMLERTVYTNMALDAVSVLSAMVLSFVSYRVPSLVDGSNTPPMPLNLPEGIALFQQLLNETLLGASGPVSFNQNGDRKSVRLQFQQLAAQNGTLLLIDAMKWDPLTGMSSLSAGTMDISGTNSIYTQPFVPAVAGSVLPNPLHWSAIPPNGVPPPRRYGACTVVTNSSSILVFGGTFSPDTSPYSDVWEFNSATLQWSERPQIGDAPVASFYGGCALHGDVVTFFGGFSREGVQGSVWSYSVSDNEWVPYATGGYVASRAQSAQFGFASNAADYTNTPGLFILGGAHKARLTPQIVHVDPMALLPLSFLPLNVDVHDATFKFGDLISPPMAFASGIPFSTSTSNSSDFILQDALITVLPDCSLLVTPTNADGPIPSDGTADLSGQTRVCKAQCAAEDVTPHLQAAWRVE